MKYIYLLIGGLFVCLISTKTYAQQAQGTTVIKDSCDVRLILKIALETDSVGDIARMQSILDECFSIECDLPCEDRRTGHCKIISKVFVVNWKNLSSADKPKYHHVIMLGGRGVSYVNEIIPPNSGRSSGGTWYRNEYSPKVYCHEAMHLCGHDDHYRDCRADRLALRVDNCKDGDTCTAAQKAAGDCPPCPGYEDDIMGNDVSKPIDCNHDIVEILRSLNNPNFVCSDECCANKPSTRTEHRKPVTELIIEGGFGYYHMQSELIKDDELKLMGLNFSIGVNANIPLCNHFDLNINAKFNYAGVSDSRTTVNGLVTLKQDYSYRLSHTSLGANIEFHPTNNFSLFTGPEVGLPLSASSKFTGVSTYNNVSTPYGVDKFAKITNKKNLQIGANIGLSYQTNLLHLEISPYLNCYLPFSNEINFTSLKNKMSRINLGALIKLF